jgi:hypothetical protein
MRPFDLHGAKSTLVMPLVKPRGAAQHCRKTREEQCASHGGSAFRTPVGRAGDGLGSVSRPPDYRDLALCPRGPATSWRACWLKLGAPRPIIETLSKTSRDIVVDKPVARQLEKIETGIFPADQATPAALRAKLASQINLWRPIVEKAGIQAE